MTHLFLDVQLKVAGRSDMAKKKAPFEAGSRTSEMASRMADPKGAQERLVLAEFHNISPKGMTDEQLEIVTGGKLHQSMSARRRDLVLKGWIRDSGEVRLNRTKRLAIIWVLGKDKGVKPGTPSPRGSRPSKKDFALASSELYDVFGKKKASPALEKVMFWLGMLAESGGVPE